MSLDLVLMMFSISVLAIASYTDLKTREVPDWLSYGFIFAVLGVRIIYSLQLGWEILLEGLLGFAAFFLLAHIFYYTGQWGGGDSKLLMGMGGVLGISLPFSTESFTILWFLLSLLFLGSIYGLIWMVITAIRKRELFVKDFSAGFNKKKKLNLMIIVAGFILVLLSFINPYFLPLLFLPILYFLLIFVNSVEKSCFVRDCKIEDLTEGDWLAEEVFVKDKKKMEKKTLQKEDVHKLSLLKKDKKIDFVRVKDGVPFVPSFLIAYLVVVFGGKVLTYVSGFVFGG